MVVFVLNTRQFYHRVRFLSYLGCGSFLCVRVMATLHTRPYVVGMNVFFHKVGLSDSGHEFLWK